MLVIDDDHLVGAMLVAHARAAGFDARVTDDAETFYTLVRDWKPTFVVVDLVMGEVDGLAVLKALAEMQYGRRGGHRERNGKQDSGLCQAVCRRERTRVWRRASQAI